MATATVNVTNHTGEELQIGLYNAPGDRETRQIIPAAGSQPVIVDVVTPNSRSIGFWVVATGMLYRFTEGSHLGQPAVTGGDLVSGGYYSVVVSKSDCSFN